MCPSVIFGIITGFLVSLFIILSFYPECSVCRGTVTWAERHNYKKRYKGKVTCKKCMRKRRASIPPKR